MWCSKCLLAACTVCTTWPAENSSRWKPATPMSRPFYQGKLRSEQGRLPGHRRRGASLRPVASKGKPASENGVHQIVFQDIRVLLEERRIVTVVRRCVTGRERFQCGARTVADALREGLNALHKARADVGPVQQHTCQKQHQIQLLSRDLPAEYPWRLPGGPRRRWLQSQPGASATLSASLVRCDGIESPAEQVEQKQALPERVDAIPHQTPTQNSGWARNRVDTGRPLVHVRPPSAVRHPALRPCVAADSAIPAARPRGKRAKALFPSRHQSQYVMRG